MKRSTAEETSKIEAAIAALDAEKSSYTDLMQQAEVEVISFEQAWKDGSLYRKRELQKALFPAGLAWFQTKRAFETSQTVSIDDIETFFSQLDNFGVPDGI